MKTRILYVDDSGHHSTGWVVFGWVEVLLDDWQAALGHWLIFRRELYGSPGIPASYEIHSSGFVSGRGNPTGRDEWDRRKALRGPVVERALDAMSGCPQIAIGSARRRVAVNHATFLAERLDVYARLVALWDAQARQAHERYLVVMDGDGSASPYNWGHRKLDLASRHVIEDPLFSPSSQSQWIQMADLVAYASYMDAIQLPEKDFSWDWYSRVQGSDSNHGALML